jgi:hypothetical protein
LPLDFRDQYFGCEIELTGITRATAAHALANLFGTRAEHSGGGYDAYRVKDLDGKEWKIVRDASIHPEGYGRASASGEYKVELNSPKLEYAEMEKLQEVIRTLRRAGGRVNSSCGMHVHVDASKHTPQSLKNVLSIMYKRHYVELNIMPLIYTLCFTTARSSGGCSTPRCTQARSKPTLFWQWQSPHRQSTRSTRSLRKRLLEITRRSLSAPFCCGWG